MNRILPLLLFASLLICLNQALPNKDDLLEQVQSQADATADSDNESQANSLSEAGLGSLSKSGATADNKGLSNAAGRAFAKSSANALGKSDGRGVRQPKSAPAPPPPTPPTSHGTTEEYFQISKQLHQNHTQRVMQLCANSTACLTTPDNCTDRANCQTILLMDNFQQGYRKLFGKKIAHEDGNNEVTMALFLFGRYHRNTGENQSVGALVGEDPELLTCTLDNVITSSISLSFWKMNNLAWKDNRTAIVRNLHSQASSPIHGNELDYQTYVCIWAKPLNKQNLPITLNVTLAQIDNSEPVGINVTKLTTDIKQMMVEDGNFRIL